MTSAEYMEYESLSEMEIFLVICVNLCSFLRRLAIAKNVNKINIDFAIENLDIQV